ncbi:1693_t:CDS:1, partial [Dentiscutata erythropus]
LFRAVLENPDLDGEDGRLLALSALRLTTNTEHSQLRIMYSETLPRLLKKKKDFKYK